MDQPLMSTNSIVVNTREIVWKIVQDVKSFLHTTDVVLPGQAELEISHHYGLDRFYETGITMITVVNREYCKKLIIVLPGQTHPEQYHNQKEETFVILHGEVDLTLNGKTQILKKGDVITIEREVRHIFTTKTGCVIEEVSSTHYVNDSYYTDENININKNRKTFVTHWL
jgi:quercetin dioxygenase-like cupin family protein